MRIASECAFCALNERRRIPLDVELNNNFFMNFTCDKGHENTTFLVTERFSVLFDLGMFALEDGYSREAVANFAASIERMHEFYIRFACKKHSIKDDIVRATWKLVASQSERQLGTFCFLYLLETGRTPADLPVVEFRNKVIHKGYIPSHAESLDYGRSVHEYMVAIVAQMNKDSSAFVLEVHYDERKRVTNETQNSNMSVNQYIPFCTNFTKYYEMGLDEKMKKRKSYRWLLPGTGPIQSREQVSSLIAPAIVVARIAGDRRLGFADASDLEVAE
jgi:hypothetical protein